MQLDTIEITNFRCFTSLTVSLSGASIFVVGENASGKSALLAAIAKALGRDSAISLADFADAKQTIEIAATLSGFDPADQGVFPDELSFKGKPTLRIGLRAAWDPAERQADVTVGFPDLTWKRATREQKDALGLLWLPAWRDPSKALQLAGTRSVLARLLAGLNIDAALDSAFLSISEALAGLAGTTEVTNLLAAARASLAGTIPGVSAAAYSLTREGVAAPDLLRDFELLLAHGGPPLPISQQSNGLAHLSLFAFALQAMTKSPKAILLVDEPEISLHPQAQRALISLIRKLPNQAIVATHSSNVLDRADPRNIMRLVRELRSVSARRPATLSEEDARWLARFANPQTAEACFARRVVLVEGYSDRLVILGLAQRLGRDLDAEGVSVLSLEGGSGIAAHLALLGKAGLAVEVLGLCDEDKEANWILEVSKAGIPVTDRATLTAAGFFVCVKDLEQEFIRSLGLEAVQALIAAEGEAQVFARFATQPAQATAALDEQLRRFLHGASVRWAVPLADAIDLKAIPGPLNDLLKRL